MKEKEKEKENYDRRSECGKRDFNMKKVKARR